MPAFNVYLGSKLIDTVFYCDSYTKEDVKKSLVNHDNYNQNIKVTKRRKVLDR